MRTQWSLIFGLVFALVTAIFAVFNVESVQVNYVFGYSSIPLILVILGSALLGGLIVGLFGIIRQYRLQRKISQLEKALQEVKQNENGIEVSEKMTETALNNREQSEEKQEMNGSKGTDEVILSGNEEENK